MIPIHRQRLDRQRFVHHGGGWFAHRSATVKECSVAVSIRGQNRKFFEVNAHCAGSRWIRHHVFEPDMQPVHRELNVVQDSRREPLQKAAACGLVILLLLRLLLLPKFFRRKKLPHLHRPRVEALLLVRTAREIQGRDQQRHILERDLDRLTAKCVPRNCHLQQADTALADLDREIEGVQNLQRRSTRVKQGGVPHAQWCGQGRTDTPLS